jgi:hypothetical protein
VQCVGVGHGRVPLACHGNRSTTPCP